MITTLITIKVRLDRGLDQTLIAINQPINLTNPPRSRTFSALSTVGSSGASVVTMSHMHLYDETPGSLLRALRRQLDPREGGVEARELLVAPLDALAQVAQPEPQLEELAQSFAPLLRRLGLLLQHV